MGQRKLLARLNSAKIDDNGIIAYVGATKSGSLIEVFFSLAPDATPTLAEIPNQFRNRVWIRRGNFVVVKAIENCKVERFTVTNVLRPDHIQDLKRQKRWFVGAYLMMICFHVIYSQILLFCFPC